MANKIKTVYICSQCGYQSPKWAGKCPECGEWNSMTEEIVQPEAAAKKSIASKGIMGRPVTLNSLIYEDEERISSGIKELDRVLGGGIVKGSLILISGDPGIGKSTLLLQICRYLSEDKRVLYITGEESVRQIKLRAERLEVANSNLLLLAETDIDIVTNTIIDQKPDIAVVDSIQTMNKSEMASSSGSVSQVRECTQELMSVTKAGETALFIVGHVNKEGAVAGPKVLEHIVDTVLYFEGERNLPFRILRAAKNRFGSTNEIGVFEMVDDGLHEVENPSMSLLSGRPLNVSGTCVACIMEGSRPVLAEVQALVSTTGFGTPRRMSAGFDYNRMAVLLAVLEKRAGYYFSNLDAYINVVGGLRLDEPAADLAVALSLVSSLKDKPLDPDTVAFGEVGLAGELRAASRADARIAEVSRLGFKRVILPYQNLRTLRGKDYGIEIVGAKSIRQAYDAITK
ncbi:MAG TPA: DNA repair protein RadA, partial [Ruminiclostridium sp.]|nr:DNA repair protein RadA [Ruminiclostridium sp.]